LHFAIDLDKSKGVRVGKKTGWDLIEKSRNDIEWFVEALILRPYNEKTGGNAFITGQQRDGLRAISRLVHDKIKGERREVLGVSIMSGKGTGKDALAAWAILWFMWSFPFPKIPCVSVTAEQLDKVLWSEISKWLSSSSIKDYFVLQSDKLYRVDVDDTERGKRWMAFKKAANPKLAPNEQVESLQGIHEVYMMQLVDEGSGILEPVFRALENNMTDICNFILLIFNPMHVKGYAVETQEHEDWVALRWNAEDSELVNQDRIKKLEKRYGKESNTYRMNVLGLPPVFDESTLINYDWVANAIDKGMIVEKEEPLVMAIDCGAGGDSSIIAMRRGNKVLPFKRKKTNDSTELSNWAGNIIDIEKPDVVRVDTIGIGWAVEGVLREKKGGIVEAADVRRLSDEPQRFYNKRAEMYWRVRDLFEKGVIEIPDDADLKDQIAATRYKTDNRRGLIQIAEKTEIKAELGKSPDEFDALAMLYYNKHVSKKSSIFLNYITKRNWMSA